MIFVAVSIYSCPVVNMTQCYFKLHLSSIVCNHSNRPLSSAGADRIRKIINSSNQRCDQLHIGLQSQLDENPNLTIACHRSCVSSYTSFLHIQRYLKRHRVSETSCSEVPTIKHLCRSELLPFNFSEHCIFGGKICVLHKGPKNPSRWGKAVLCRASDRGPSNKRFKEVIFDVCKNRNDEWALQVEVQLQGAISDLHAADAHYHDDCRTNFMAPRSGLTASGSFEQCGSRGTALE